MDGGMIVSNDKEKIDYFREQSLNGMSFAENNWERVQTSIGWKMYLNSAQAYVALNNLRKLDDKKRRLLEIKEKYNSELGCNNTSDHLYRISVAERSDTQSSLKDAGIVTGVHYKCLHQHPLFDQHILLPKSELEQDRTLSIPFHEKLTDEEVQHILCKVKQFMI